MQLQSALLERFLRYVKINTQSNDKITGRCPTTDGQWDLARLLVQELQALGLQDAAVNDKCFVTATLPANIEKEIPVIGFLSHIDTSPDFSGKDVRPQVIQNYDGGEILLNKEKNFKLSPGEFPELKDYVGQTLVTTDGTTLLGADDKAGVAEIMTALEFLIAHPEIRHGTLKVAFTPDEETGEGVANFDVKGFGAQFAYTLDGGAVGELEYENFNAARVILDFHGKSVHPGDAKGILVNATLLAMEFNAMLPPAERPEHTEGREGYFHLHEMSGDVSAAHVIYAIREFDRQKYEQRKTLMQHCIDFIHAKYGAGSLDAVIEDRYFNMLEVLEKEFHIVQTAEQAMRQLGIEPIMHPIRGGTDGSRLSFMGLPTPNLFAGGINFHGPYEFVALPSMEKAVQVMLKIVELYANR